MLRKRPRKVSVTSMSPVGDISSPSGTGNNNTIWLPPRTTVLHRNTGRICSARHGSKSRR
eukprot:3143675-Prorocentrum_lima.AAC.1